METEDSIKDRSKRLQSALEGAFGVRARSLHAALRKTGRRLPRRLHADARTIVEAEALGGHPKLLRHLDSATLTAAEARVVDWLDSVDRAEARKAYWIHVGATIGFNFLAIVALVVVWMWWTSRI